MTVVTTDFAVSADSYMRSDLPDSNFGSQAELYWGVEVTGGKQPVTSIRRPLWRATVSGLEVLWDAALYVYNTAIQGTLTGDYFLGRRDPEDSPTYNEWGEEQVTWNVWWTGYPWVTPGGDVEGGLWGAVLKQYGPGAAGWWAYGKQADQFNPLWGLIHEVANCISTRSGQVDILAKIENEAPAASKWMGPQTREYTNPPYLRVWHEPWAEAGFQVFY